MSRRSPSLNPQASSLGPQASFSLRALLRDPLYRYEARRYWTVRRYVLTTILLVFVLGMGLVFVLTSARVVVTTGGVTSYSYLDWTVEERIRTLLGLHVLCRLPMCLLAATGAALCIVPEKVSGQLEQFILTPVDPGRFCMARYAGRLRGMVVFWALATLGCIAFVALLALPGSLGPGPGQTLLVLLVLWAAQVDMAAMLLVDAAVGMRFTATCRSTPAALIKTYLTAFVLVPAGMFLGALAGGGVVHLLDWYVLHLGHIEVPYLVVCLLTRLALAVLAVRLALRDAHRAMEKLFYRPGEP